VERIAGVEMRGGLGWGVDLPVFRTSDYWTMVPVGKWLRSFAVN